MTKEQNDNIEKYIQLFEDLLQDKQKTEQLKNDLSRMVKMLEESNRMNADDHKEFRKLFNEIIYEDSNTKSMVERKSQYLSELMEREIRDVKKDVQQVRERNFFAYAWEWIKKDLKYIILLLSFININHILNFVRELIDLFGL